MFGYDSNVRHEFDWVAFLAGVVSVLLSIFLFRNPGKGLKGLVVIFAVVSIMQGLVRLSPDLWSILDHFDFRDL